MITLTEKAAAELKDLMASENKPEAALRVWVSGGGCSGLNYGMALDSEKPEQDDQIFENNGVKVYIDSLSLSYMSGSSVDYVDDPSGGGFKIDNPNAVSTCGCGSSFSAGEGSGCGCGSGGCGCGSHDHAEAEAEDDLGCGCSSCGTHDHAEASDDLGCGCESCQ